MRTILLMFDSLNRHALAPYGASAETPNFERLAQRSLVFDNHYVGSMPCIPARRELHTGQYNFLQRSWGPLEPFDHSILTDLTDAGINSHLITDHPHYWEDGGATYHNRFSSYQFIRGQEGDKWQADYREQVLPEHFGQMKKQDQINRQYIRQQDQFPMKQVFQEGLAFLERNQKSDRWFLQLECFDPHEPFVLEEAAKLADYQGPLFDWPNYAEVTEPPAAVAQLREQYQQLVASCDAYLGQVLDYFDQYDLWQDTTLIVTTDHGFLLGEHETWGKCIQPFYQEVAHIPLFYWQPDMTNGGQRSQALTQTIDIAPTILTSFGLPLPATVKGRPLLQEAEADRCLLFGIHGGQVNITDGHYVFMKAPVADNQPLYNYTLMPTHMRNFFSKAELQSAEWLPSMDFSNGYPVMKIAFEPNAAGGVSLQGHYPDLLFDILQDPLQKQAVADETLERFFKEKLVTLLKENQAPKEQFVRLGLK